MTFKLVLTPRQRVVAALYVAGLSHKESARLLGCGPETVKSHLTAIKKANHLHSRSAIICAFSVEELRVIQKVAYTQKWKIITDLFGA